MRLSPSMAVGSSTRLPPRPHRAPKPTINASQTQHAPKLASYVSRRPVVWAGGFAVIVIAGSILGAQIKSRQQAQEREGLQRATRIVSNPEEVSIAPNANIPEQKPTPTKLEIEKQIAFLEERRGSLLAQKLSLQRKLEEVERKRTQEQEMQAKRVQDLSSVK